MGARDARGNRVTPEVCGSVLARDRGAVKASCVPDDKG
jgi:hypothetical protein